MTQKELDDIEDDIDDDDEKAFEMYRYEWITAHVITFHSSLDEKLFGSWMFLLCADPVTD